jgi:anti-sigma-K factor RskA
MDYARPARADALAAAYVAGTLRGRARRRFEALLPAHGALREAVRVWQGRLLPLTLVLAPEPPPAQVWRGIERRLWPAAASPASASSWWQRLGLWRALSGLSSAAAIALAIVLVVPGEQSPPIVIVLQGSPGTPQAAASLVASFNADGRALVTRPLAPVALEANRVLELWAVPPQGAPRSLGLISGRGVTVIPRQRLPRDVLDTRATSALAVSVEPLGGSPTGAPTGPVVFAGRLAR